MITLKKWIASIVNELPSDSSATLQNAIISVCYRVLKTKPDIFSTSSVLPKNSINQLASLLSKEAETADELTATTYVLEYLYDFHLAKNPSLICPKVSLPLSQERPLVDDNTPCFSILSLLRSTLLEKHPTVTTSSLSVSDIQQASIGHSILMVVFKSGIVKKGELQDLLKAKQEQWVIINADEPIASLYLSTYNRRIYLTQEALLAIHKLHDEFKVMGKAKINKIIENSIATWLRFVSCFCPVHQQSELQKLTQSQVIKYLSFFDRSAGLSHLWQSHHAMENHTFIRAFSGKILTHHVNRQLLAPKSSSTLSRQFTDKLETVQHDKSIIHKLSAILTKYKTRYDNEKHSKSTLKRTKEEVEALLTLPMGWSVGLAIHWIAALLAHGSPYKEKLRASTLLNYLSAIHRFIQLAWTEGAPLTETIDSFEARCQYGINRMVNAEEQRTVLRFLQYCCQYPQFPAIDTDTFELKNRKGLTRAHYIPPAMFDDICARFSPSQEYSTQQITRIMQLCYYAGLREDEALSLHINDLSFDVGFIYITGKKERKSHHAIRKIPLALIPNHVLTQLLEYQNERRALVSNSSSTSPLLFDRKPYAIMEDKFIHFLRQELQDNTLVTHSLRHCTANNWVYLLTVCAFEPEVVPELFFTRHPLFSPQHREQLTLSLANCGTQLTPYFPILDFVSEKLGHSSMQVTHSTYLHLLDWVSLIANRNGQSVSVTTAAIRYWTSNSNYGFEKQKQLLNNITSDSKTGILNTQTLTAWVKQYWKNSQCYSVIETMQATSLNKTDDKLAFSTYHYEIRKQLLEITTQNKKLLTWLQSTGYNPVYFDPSLHQVNSWQHLCLEIDSWTNLTSSKITARQTLLTQFLSFFLSKNEISRYRDLYLIIKVYKLLKLNFITVKITTRYDAHSLKQWITLLNKYEIKYLLIEGTGKPCVTIRPYRLRWPLWEDIGTIIQQLIDYLFFLQHQLEGRNGSLFNSSKKIRT